MSRATKKILVVFSLFLILQVLASLLLLGVLDWTQMLRDTAIFTIGYSLSAIP